MQGNVFYSCAVDNIIKVWDRKDGTLALTLTLTRTRTHLLLYEVGRAL